MAKKKKKQKFPSYEEIVKTFSDLFNNHLEEKKPTREPSIKHYVWEEDGKRYSSWRIDTGSSIINTGDGGMELFLKELKKAGMSIPPKIEENGQ